jgi:hypothetical protein
VCIGANAPARRETVGSPWAFRVSGTPHQDLRPLAALLADRTAPEPLCLEAKFASLMLYSLTTELLGEILPMGHAVNAATMGNHLYKVAQRCEDELGDEQTVFVAGCERDWEDLPRPDLPLTVGVDGGCACLREKGAPRRLVWGNRGQERAR